MPLKPAGCQVIEETQSAQPHRLAEQESVSGCRRGKRHGMRAAESERDPIIRAHLGEEGWRYSDVTGWG